MENQPKGFIAAQKKAEALLKDEGRLKKLLKDAWGKGEFSKEKLKFAWQDLTALLRLVKSWKNGEYRKVPLKTIIFALTAIVYFVNPFDLIPDFILLWGYIDDITVIGFVMKAIHDDLEKFRAWERGVSGEPSPEIEGGENPA